MSVPVPVLESHLRYTAWASRRLVDAAAELTAGELTRDFGTSEKSVLGALVHVFAADRVWLARVQGQTPAKFDPETDMRLATLQSDWPGILDRWLAFAHEPDRVAEYKDLKGNSHRTPVWQIVLHLVNHGTHHRGQVSGMLRAMGKTPPVLDLIHFYRQGL